MSIHKWHKLEVGILTIIQDKCLKDTYKNLWLVLPIDTREVEWEM